ncbi:MAG: hypothetical protein SFY80_04110 [Verrucomicrobiota bacterium]|nr:hypothetical protein [Verrucomicrobiota bacterium]
MNINIIKDSIPIITSFDLHRGESDNLLGSVKAIKLKNNYTLAIQVANTAAYTGLVYQDGEIRGDLRNATAQRDQARESLVTHTVQFLQIMSHYGDTLGTERKLPKAPSLTTGQVALSQIATAVGSIWTQVDESGSTELALPLVLGDGFSKERYLSELEALNNACTLMLEKRRALAILRQQRDTLLKDVIKPRLSEYRTQVKIHFPKNHWLRTTLPKFSTSSGSNPDAVVVSGAWDTNTLKATLQWNACAHPELDHYEVRACSGSVYKTAEDYNLATLPKEQLTYQTDAGLAAMGSSIAIKVYPVTKKGRTAGSNTLKITRTSSSAVAQAA